MRMATSQVEALDKEAEKLRALNLKMKETQSALAAADTLWRVYRARRVFAFAKRGFNLARAVAALLSLAALLWLLADCVAAGGASAPGRRAAERAAAQHEPTSEKEEDLLEALFELGNVAEPPPKRLKLEMVRARRTTRDPRVFSFSFRALMPPFPFLHLA